MAPLVRGEEKSVLDLCALVCAYVYIETGAGEDVLDLCALVCAYVCIETGAGEECT